MKRFDHLRTITFLILAYGIFTGNSCFKTTDTDVDSPCGESTYWSHDFKPREYKSYDLVGNIRYFTYEDLSTPDAICSEEHSKVSYYAALSNTNHTPLDTSIKMTGYAYWSLFGHEKSLAWRSSGAYRGDDEIGLKQAFPKGTGYIGLQLHIRFPTLGTFEKDLHFIDSAFAYFSIYYDYKKVKF